MANFQEQYDALIQQLEEKGIPQPRLLVPAAALVLLAALLFFAVPALLPSEATVTFSLQDAAGKAVPNAQVTLLAGQKEFTATSDAAGSVSFKKVPADQKLSVRISAAGYAPETQRIAYDVSVVRLAAAAAPSEIRFSAQVLTDQRIPVDSATVRFTLDDGSSSIDVTDDFGEAKTSLADSQRVVVEVSKDGYKAQRRSVILTDQKSVEIVLEKSAEPTPSATPAALQSVLVRVSDSKGAPVHGVSVELHDESTQALLRLATTDAQGEGRLDRINANVAFIVTVNDPQDRYFAYTSPYALVPGAEPVLITLDAAPENEQLVVNIKDKAGNALDGVTVTAYDKRTAAYLSSVDSDSSGRAALTLGASEALLTVFKDGFLPASLSARNKETRSVTLESSEGKTVAVQVTVRKNLEPAPEAFVQLYSNDGFPLGLPGQYAAADGTVAFQAPKGSASIHARASLDASKGESDRAVLQSDVQWIVTLLPPKVPFKVRVLDAVSQKPVNGATVRFVTNDAKLSCKTTDGACQVDVPAETEFRILIDHSSYLAYQSATQLVASDQPSAQNDAKLYPKSLTQSATVQFQGFYTLDGKLLREAQNAQRLQARFLVSLPAASADDRARFSVRIAESPTPVALITAVDGSDVFFTGSDPAQACNPPASDNNSEAGQWAVLEFAKGFSGTQQVTVDFFTAPDAKPPAALWIQYDLHGLKSGVPFTYPLDSEKLQQLLSQSGITEQDFCGQKSTSARLPISRDVLTCQDGYCSKAVFVTASGQRFAQSASLPAGSAFGMDLDLIGLQAGISQVQISAPASVQLLSLQVVGPSGSGNLTQSDFETDATNRVTVSLQAAKNEKVRLRLEARAVRADALAQIEIQLDDADGGQATIVRNLVITGTNRFSVTLSDLSAASDVVSVTPLEAGIDRNLRVRVLDQFNKRVDDASVELYECEGSPLNGQELISSEGRNGVYLFKFQPATLGLIGIRVSHPQFVTYEECVLPVRAVDFITAEPESIVLKGDTRKDTPTETVSVATLLDVKSKVTSSVQCTDANGSAASAPFSVSPKSFTLKDSTAVRIQANPQAFKGRCDVTFMARINKDNAAAAQVSVEIDLQGRPPAEKLCPTAQAGVKCMSASEATQLRCTKTSLSCEDEAQACYQCNLGPQTLPGQISLSVSNYQSDATQTYAIALEDNPEECRVEGFTNNPASAPYGYNNPYGQNPYGYQTGYSAPNSYYAYQPNAYTPYATNPFLAQGTCQPYAGSYPYGTSYAPNYASAYPSGYVGGYPNAGVGTYPGTYPATPGINPSTSVANPASPFASCQAIIAKLSPYCQAYFNQPYSGYNNYQNYYGGSYRDPWSSTLNPTYPSPASYQYPQQRATVNVQADCTRTELRVTAQYTGGDTNYGGALGGNQQGYLLVRTGGQTKQIPITIVVQTPFGPGAYPGGYPGGNFPGGYPTGQVPPQCILEYQQAVQAAYQQPAAQEQGLDDSGLPDTIDVYYNKYTGFGVFEREFKAPAGGQLAVVKPTQAQVKMDVTGNKIRVGVTCKKNTKDKETTFECPDSVPFKATWTFYNLQTVQKDRTIRISQDDFAPSIIQLLATKDKKDAAIFDVTAPGSSDFAKAKCKDTANAKCRQADSQISAEASSAVKDGKLEISGLGDYQLRTIPVRASTVTNSISVKAGDAESKYEFSGPLTATPTCEVVNAEKKDVKSAVTVECTKESVKVKPKEGLSSQQTGWIEITFEDSARNHDKVAHKPQIQLIVDPKDGTTTNATPITLTPPSGKVIVGQEFTVGHKFPGNDDKASRSITLTLTPTGAPNAMEQVKRQLDDEGTTTWKFDQVGTVKVRADSKLGGKDILSNILTFSVEKADTTTPPAGPQPPSGPSGPDGVPSTGAIEFNWIQPHYSVNQFNIDLQIKGDKAAYDAAKKSWAKYVVYLKEDSSHKVERPAVSTAFSASASFGEGYIDSGFTYWIAQPINQFSPIKDYLAAHNADTVTLVLEAYDASNKLIGQKERAVKASDFGIPAAGSTPATGGGSGAPGGGGAGAPSGSGKYESKLLSSNGQVYEVQLAKDGDSKPPFSVRIRDQDMVLLLDSIKDGPTVKLRITDTAGSRWNCAGFFQWGYELHLDKSHNPVTCYTNSLFQTSANVKVTLLTGTIPGSQEGQRYSYWAGYRLGIVTIRVEPG